MICCDTCDEWYHGSCVGITLRESKKVEKYVCPKCNPSKESPKQIKTEPHTQRSRKRNGVDETPNEESIKRTRTESSAHKRPLASPSANEQGVTSPSDRKCAYQNCNFAAKPSSKYCSDTCSMAVAREMIKKKQEENNTTSASDAADMGMLEDIARRKADIDEKLRKLEQEQQDLEEIIQFNAKRNILKDSLSPPISPMINSTALPVVDTSIQSVANIDHMEGHKKGKRSEGDEVCGCPTTDFASGYCELIRKNCVKHVNWENMKRDTLEREKAQHQTALSTLIVEESQVRNRMARRKERASDAHRTIVEA